jgi:hypothetical protein
VASSAPSKSWVDLPVWWGIGGKVDVGVVRVDNGIVDIIDSVSEVFIEQADGAWDGDKGRIYLGIASSIEGELVRSELVVEAAIRAADMPAVGIGIDDCGFSHCGLVVSKEASEFAGLPKKNRPLYTTGPYTLLTFRISDGRPIRRGLLIASLVSLVLL